GPTARRARAATPTSTRAATGAGSASAPTSSATDMAELEMLQLLNRNYVRSVLESDVRWFEANLAPDFMNSNPDGTLVDRAGFLKQVAKPCAVSKLREEDVHIQVVADVAIIYAGTTYGK